MPDSEKIKKLRSGETPIDKAYYDLLDAVYSDKADDELAHVLALPKTASHQVLLDIKDDELYGENLEAKKKLAIYPILEQLATKTGRPIESLTLTDLLTAITPTAFTKPDTFVTYQLVDEDEVSYDTEDFDLRESEIDDSQVVKWKTWSSAKIKEYIDAEIKKKHP